MQLIQIVEPTNTQDKEYLKFTCLISEEKETVRLSLVKINDLYAVTSQTSKSCTACIDEEEIIEENEELTHSQLCYQAHILDKLASKYKVIKHQVLSQELKDEPTIPEKHFVNQ